MAAPAAYHGFHNHPMNRLPSRLFPLFTIFATTFALCDARPPGRGTPPPDVTRTAIEDTSHTYHLGPTGARGWIHMVAFRATPDDYEQYFCTDNARQILITQVADGSPADGVLQPGDVILGIGDEPFTTDARRTLANAIDEAEREENQGKLHLLRWRPNAPDAEGATTRPAGSREMVTLQLRTMPAFSETAPFDCPKSEVIIADAKRRVMERGLGDRLHIGALGLLATGDEDAIEAVREFIQSSGIASSELNLTVEEPRSMVSWSWSYAALLLGEYYQITGDKSVLPALKEYAVHLAKGQAICGSWGHKMADLQYNDGMPQGRLTGYGTLNHPALTCLLALVVAERCGIEHPEITRAIGRAGDFYGYFAGKGCIPYGHGQPLEYLLANNGMSAFAAFAFAINGQNDRAEFFARMCAAAHDKTEVGHTGSYFGLFLTPLGANVAGPETTAAFFKHHRWIQTLSRRWDGGFVYQPPGGRWGGSSESYYNLSSDGAFLMFYAAPRRNLLITGRDADESTWLTGDDATEAVRAGLFDADSLDDAGLIALLGHPVPKMRRMAADALGSRGTANLPTFVEMLENGTPQQRIGAVHAIGALGESASSAAPTLITLIEDPTADAWLRSRALNALPKLGDPTRDTLEGLLRTVLEEKPHDPRRDLDMELSATLARMIGNPYASDFDFALFHAAVNKLLSHPHHHPRNQAMRMLAGIPLEHFHAVSDRMLEVIRNDSLHYETYHNDAARATALNILARLHIRDGMSLAIETMEPNKWGQGARIYGRNGRLPYLQTFGADAQAVLPDLQAMREAGKLNENADPFIAKITAATKTRKLISLDEAVHAGLYAGAE